MAVAGTLGAKINFNLLTPKKKHIEIYKSIVGGRHSFITADGGVRNGKTTICTIAAIDNLIVNSAMDMPEANTALFAAKSLEGAKSNLLNVANQYLEHEYNIILHKRDSSQYYFNFDYKGEKREVVIYIAGANNKTSQDRIQGKTTRVVLLDEAVLFPQNFLHQAQQRASSFGKHKKIILATNPEGDKSHWYYTEYILKSDKHFSIKTIEGGIVDLDEIETMRKRLGTNVFRQRYLAEWVNASDDAAFPEFEPQFTFESVYWKQDNPDKKTWSKQYLVIDPGGKDSTAITEFTIVNNKVVVSDLWYHSQRESGIMLTHQKVANFVKKQNDIQNYDAIIVDNEVTLVEAMRQIGLFKARTVENKNREQQYSRTHLLCYSDLLFFAKDIDITIINQIKNAKTDSTGKKIAKPDNNSVNEHNQIHALDTLCYFAINLWRGKGAVENV